MAIFASQGTPPVSHHLFATGVKITSGKFAAVVNYTASNNDSGGVPQMLLLGLNS
jgi:hypothetical protein